MTMESNMNVEKNMPMRELEKLTGFPRATINFYIKEGLLPSPEKSAKNMAYYDDEFVQRLNLIQKLKNADIPLNHIKRILNNQVGINTDLILDALLTINRLLPFSTNEQPVTLEQIKELGFEDEKIQEIIKLSIIQPIDQDGMLFPSYCLTICKLLKYFLDLGITLSVAKDIVVKMRELTKIEKDAFNNYINRQMVEKNLSIEDQGKALQESIEKINSLLPLLHLQLMKSTDQDTE